MIYKYSYSCVFLAKAYKYCELSGIWETKNGTNGTFEYTHYEGCLLPQLQELAKMCEDFGDSICAQVKTLLLFLWQYFLMF